MGMYRAASQRQITPEVTVTVHEPHPPSIRPRATSVSDVRGQPERLVEITGPLDQENWNTQPTDRFPTPHLLLSRGSYDSFFTPIADLLLLWRIHPGPTMVKSRYRLWALYTVCRLDPDTGHDRRRDARVVWNSRGALRPHARERDLLAYLPITPV